jgi:phage terminase large subunit-like protein
VWVEQGWLKAPAGTSVDHSVIRETLGELRKHYDIERIAFDPYHADQIIRQLKEDGFSDEQVLEWPQQYSYMTSGESRFIAEVLAGNVDARKCPVTAWAASNVISVPDGKDNPMFSKRKSRGRIDPIKAAAIGMSVALRLPRVEPVGVSAEWL